MPKVLSLKRLRESQLIRKREPPERSGVSRITVACLETGAEEARFSTIRKPAAALVVSPAAMTQEDRSRDSPRRCPSAPSGRRHHRADSQFNTSPDRNYRSEA